MIRMPKLLKISKRSNRKVEGKQYWKYSVNISNGLMDKLEWSGDTEVKLSVKDKKLVIEKEE